MSDLEALLVQREIALVRAPNPGPFTLSGTNTWILGRGPAWVVDPGPAIPSHLEALEREISLRGGLGGVALTHSHADHTEAVDELLAHHPAPLAASGGGEVDLRAGGRFGPFEAVPTPGHSEDHVALIARRTCFTGDAVLGEGSVFVYPYRGAMADYLGALRELAAREDFDLLCPGHGPVVADAHAKIEQYIAHREDRERALLEALDAGARSVDEMLGRAWPEVPAPLLGAAAVTLAAHLDKLDGEGRLPAGVERPDLELLAAGGAPHP